MKQNDMLSSEKAPKSLKKKTPKIGGKRLSKAPVIIAIAAVGVILLSVIFITGKDKAVEPSKRPEQLGNLQQSAIPSAVDAAKISEEKKPDQREFSAGRASYSRETKPSESTQDKFDEVMEKELQKIQLDRFKRYHKALAAGMESKINRVDYQKEEEEAGQQLLQQALLRGAAHEGDPMAGLNSILNAQNVDHNMQDIKTDFFTKERSISYLPHRKQKPISPYELKTGTVIPAVMISGINSDLPGDIIGQVSQDVYDTATGEYLLLPQGTRVFGGYDSHISVGQERVMIAWNRLIFPDGSTIELGNMGGTDQAGYAGFEDQVDNHYFKIFGSALLMSFIGAGYQLSQPKGSGDGFSSREIVAAQIGQNLSQASAEMIKRNLRIQPTIKIRPGYRFNVMISKDIILEPYEKKRWDR